eukprot:CAMPEP_0202965834 /NCGR_PEP_ID=MMETSP1396-20130829/9936_1 /ASSEMBLY_ACC=CAM_ASM_000872 /TAXON_ID= /ORGANISM="Pseudokeronopsis sp., Strain Brazil" /LENGTH=203 /DNA_ID=CAMNT_0049688957 /DNA_START=116 /DNA_END=727 /DNA_ORIENTATION=+
MQPPTAFQHPSSHNLGGVSALDPSSQGALGEEGMPMEPEKKPIIPPEILEDMKNIFGVFDVEGKNEVPIYELRTILRALDKDPIEEELEFLTAKIDPEMKGFFSFEILHDIMEDKLKDVDTFDDLFAEFKKLDKDQDGRIPKPEFKQFMMNMGSKFNLEQIEEMMKEADPKGEGFIDIEEFAHRLCPPKVVAKKKKGKKKRGM